MKTFKTELMTDIAVDKECLLVLGGGDQKKVLTREINFSEEHLHFDLEAFIVENCKSEIYSLEFMFNHVKFSISLQKFGDLEMTMFSLVPYTEDGKMIDAKAEQEGVHIFLKPQDVAAFATDIYIIINDKT